MAPASSSRRLFSGQHFSILMAAAKSSSVTTTSAAVTTKTGITKPVSVSTALAKFLGASESSRTGAVKNVWEYIKLHDLQLRKQPKTPPRFRRRHSHLDSDQTAAALDSIDDSDRRPVIWDGFADFANQHSKSLNLMDSSPNALDVSHRLRLILILSMLKGFKKKLDKLLSITYKTLLKVFNFKLASYSNSSIASDRRLTNMGVGFIVGVLGVLILSHAAYATVQYRNLLKITEEEFSGPPLNVVLELIVGLILSMWAGLTVPGKFLSILPDSDENRIVSLPANQDFMIFNHRGRAFPSEIRLKLK